VLFSRGRPRNRCWFLEILVLSSVLDQREWRAGRATFDLQRRQWWKQGFAEQDNWLCRCDVESQRPVALDVRQLTLLLESMRAYNLVHTEPEITTVLAYIFPFGIATSSGGQI